MEGGKGCRMFSQLSEAVCGSLGIEPPAGGTADVPPSVPGVPPSAGCAVVPGGDAPAAPAAATAPPVSAADPGEDEAHPAAITAARTTTTRCMRSLVAKCA